MKILKRIGLILGGIVVLLVVGAFVMSMVGANKYDATYEVTASLLTEAPADSTSLANGAHLANIHGCIECHGESLEGRIFADAPPFLVTAANLTAGNGGLGQTYSVADFDRAIRYGVNKDGKALIIMPSKTLHYLSDSDTEDLIAYLQSVEPVDNALPNTELRFLGRMIAGMGGLDLSEGVHQSVSRDPMPEIGVTVEYGKYLSSITCTYCHGDDLRGLPPIDPVAPPGSDLAAIGSMSLETFENAIRMGTALAGHEMDPLFMPWTAFQHMTDDELAAIHMYLATLDG